MDSELKAALLPLLRHTRSRLLAHGTGERRSGGLGTNVLCLKLQRRLRAAKRTCNGSLHAWHTACCC